MGLSTKIDLSKPFLPESLTPLFFTSIYKELSEWEKIRYNQLQGLYFNEQFMFFEGILPQRIASALLKHPQYHEHKAGLDELAKDEASHYKLFKHLNKACEPELYKDNDFFFIKPPPIIVSIWKHFGNNPIRFPLILWLILVQEEKAVYYGKCFARDKDKLEPKFCKIHLKHLEDEGSHCDHGSIITNAVWSRKSKLARKVNAFLFQWVLKEFFTAPKRSGMTVIDHWLTEFPEHQSLRSAIKKEYYNFNQNKAYVSSLYSKDVISMSLNCMKSHDEFSNIVQYYYDLPNIKYS